MGARVSSISNGCESATVFMASSGYDSSLFRTSSATKISRIAPANSTGTSLSRVKSLSSAHLRAWISFWDAFGAFGPLLIAVVLISIAWTTWLVVLTLAPNETANYLMNTAEFDNGQFWLIVDPEFGLKVLSVAALVIVDACYVCILLKLISWRDRNPKRAKAKRHQWKRFTWIVVLYERIKYSWRELGGIRGRYRKYWNVWQKTVDLTMQSIMLRQLLQDGFSELLVMGYAVFLCVNALSVAAGILLGNLSALSEILIDSIFDMIAAVQFPILVLWHSYNNFDFDRELFNVYIDVLPPGSFECSARLFADPAERELFIASLNSLRVLSYTDLLLRVSMNLSFCHRFVTVINLMVETTVMEKSGRSRRETLSYMFRHQRHVPKLSAVLFVAFGAAAIAYTQKSIATAHEVCSPHPECVVYAYKWGNDKSCPCRTFVDVYRTPRTYQEWMEPVDVFDKVQTLSRSGMLQNIQLINRALRRWPDGLQRCNNLQYLSLIYTETEELPAWAKDWKYLQFLHIEGKQLRPTLTHLSEDLFSNMPFLQMVHLGVHPALPTLPPLLGVPNLQSLTLACLYAVTALPSFENIHNLQRFELAYLVALQTLPDLAPLQNLVEFTIFSICAACCNGFMGSCNLTDPFCTGNPEIGVSASTCLAESERATPATQLVLQRFAPSTCIRSGFDSKGSVDLLTRAQIEMCDGVPFRRCEYPPNSGQLGICMNNRMQALGCVVNDDYVRLRRVQIQRRVGPPCDAVEEAWLGCSN